VAGVAVHWYQDFIAPTVALSSTHKKFPEKFILATEACSGAMPWDIPKVALGSWKRGEDYAHDIIQVPVITAVKLNM
jgi:glucosylceramidase